MNAEIYESLPTSSMPVHMTAGAFAGIMEHCVMYPLDSVKTRMQALTPGPGGGGGMGEVLIRMVRQEGLLRPIRGMSAMVVGAGPAHALYFSCYEFIKDKLLSSRTLSEFNLVAYGVAGCVATLLHDGVMNPAEVVKQRLQMYNSPYQSVTACIKNVYQNEGAKAFYRSYTTQLAMNVPFQMIHFMTYEVAQAFTNPQHIYNPIAHVESGALAGAVAAAVTTPLDVCKTLLNTQNGVHARGMIDAFKKVYAHSGIRGYFRGLNARIIYQMPATAICWSTYEFFKYILQEKQDDGYHRPEADNDASGTNQNQAGSSRSSRFQDVSVYLNKTAPTSVLLDVSTS
ncbi:PREDICTED: mitoferrin-2 [Dufourea novaeangliae]|uniref:Mitoferrin-2 n=1 Tax=Dufourea novaeangliae TaxID=178035 RepID=A0A154P7U6_DUFNO|nr:PREDICTED: mitoferrin-2 [Dufourea novaeangliae]XP_015429577.1 PREDICTED: mitoferrin-2 [Dufourea novaeangliae]KZC07995.1 Mitoferrin-2 [Dufourea novaeangliae]